MVLEAVPFGHRSPILHEMTRTWDKQPLVDRYGFHNITEESLHSYSEICKLIHNDLTSLKLSSPHKLTKGFYLTRPHTIQCTVVSLAYLRLVLGPASEIIISHEIGKYSYLITGLCDMNPTIFEEISR